MNIRKKAFSLVEMMVVLGVFGIIIPVLYWVFNSNQLIFHRTTKQQAIQEGIRDCLNKMIIDVKSTYQFEEISDNRIALVKFNGDALANPTQAPQMTLPKMEVTPAKTVQVEYVFDSAKRIIEHKVAGKTRDTYPYIDEMKVTGLKPDTNYTFAKGADVKNAAGFSIYIKGEYYDASMKGKPQQLEVETRMFSHFRRNFLIYGYDGTNNKPFFPEGGYFTNLAVGGTDTGNQEF